MDGSQNCNGSEVSMVHRCDLQSIVLHLSWWRFLGRGLHVQTHKKPKGLAVAEAVLESSNWITTNHFSDRIYDVWFFIFSANLSLTCFVQVMLRLSWRNISFLSPADRLCLVLEAALEQCCCGLMVLDIWSEGWFRCRHSHLEFTRICCCFIMWNTG